MSLALWIDTHLRLDPKKSIDTRRKTRQQKNHDALGKQCTEVVHQFLADRVMKHVFAFMLLVTIVMKGSLWQLDNSVQDVNH